MLILTRRIGESIMIGDDIKVTIFGERGGQVRVGIEAPRELAVDRQEIYEKKLANPERIIPTSTYHARRHTR